jgi:MatE
MRRQRLALGDKELRRQDNRVELAADREEYLSIITNDFDAVDNTRVAQNHVPDVKPGRSEVASRVSSHAYSRTTGVRSRRGNRDGSSLSGASRRRGDGSANSGASRRRGNSPEPSILSGLEDHVISPNDAADANDPGYYILPKQEVEDDQDIDICWGKRAWWRPIILMEGFNRLVHLSEYDYEMKRVLKLCVPYSITALLEGVVDSIHVGLVSQFIGTEAVAAYTMVHVILGITSQFMKGILDSEATLCSHAVGAGNYALAGQYVQVCALIFTALMIPNIALWTFYLDDVILLFGFEKHVALLGLEYGRVFLFHEWLKGIYSAYAGLLNVIGYENFITTMVVVEGLVSVVCTAVLVLFRDATLQEVAMVHLAVGLVFFLVMVWISICHGRMHKFLSGMFGTCAIFVSWIS